nr:DUF1722 domain-containing protein [Actinomycetota bacterium]
MQESEAPRWRSDERVRVGVSSCLLGERVRFDGGHKRDAWLTDVFGEYVEWVPVCPEVEIGMGAPRESIRLQRAGQDVRLVAPKSGRDFTEEMKAFAARRANELTDHDLVGFVFKKASPSCGIARVRIYEENGMPGSSGPGLFSAHVMERWPILPVEEEGRLRDARLRDNFVERVFAYRRLKSLFAEHWTLGDLVAFHSAHKLTLLSHSQAAYRELGRIVAGGKGLERDELRHLYSEKFMGTLARVATRKSHTNVLHHVMGFFKDVLGTQDRHEILRLVEDYRTGLVPLVVPLTLIGHHLDRSDISYLQEQVYLQGQPKELKLRNEI